MHCVYCGSRMAEWGVYCPSCGRSQGPPPPPPPPAISRVKRFLQPVWICWYVYGGFSLLFGTIYIALPIGLAFVFSLDPNQEKMPPIFFALFAVLGLLFLAAGAASLLGAWGLQMRKPWARNLVVVCSFLACVNIPYGTAVGVFSLYVLLPRESADEYARLAPPEN